MNQADADRAAIALSEAYAAGGRDAMAAMIERVSLDAVARWVEAGGEPDDTEILMAIGSAMVQIGEQAALLIQAQMSTRQ